MAQCTLPSHAPSSQVPTGILYHTQKRPLEKRAPRGPGIHDGTPRCQKCRPPIRAIVAQVVCLGGWGKFQAKAAECEGSPSVRVKFAHRYLCGYQSGEASGESATLKQSCPCSRGLLDAAKILAMKCEAVSSESPVWKRSRPPSV